MFTKKNLRKEIDAKLERKTPHLEAYEKTPAPVVRKKMGWLAPVLSLSLSAVFLLGSSFLIVHLIRNHPNSGSEQATGELASSQVQETGTNGQSDPSLTFYTENHGYFSLSSAEASKKELALDAALNDGKQNEAQVQISFFVGFQGLNGDSLYEGNNSAFSGKTLRAITSSATLKCEEGATYSGAFSNVFTDAHFQIELVEKNHSGSWGYRHYFQESLVTLDCSSLPEGSGVLRFVFALEEIGENYRAEISVFYQKQSGLVSLAKQSF